MFDAETVEKVSRLQSGLMPLLLTLILIWEKSVSSILVVLLLAGDQSIQLLIVGQIDKTKAPCPFYPRLSRCGSG
jgi:hypothetical protein